MCYVVANYVDTADGLAEPVRGDAAESCHIVFDAAVKHYVVTSWGVAFRAEGNDPHRQ
jgi:hypothetical protein